MGGVIGNWDASSSTDSGNACGSCEAVEDPRCTAAQALVVMPLLMNH